MAGEKLSFIIGSRGEISIQGLLWGGWVWGRVSSKGILVVTSGSSQWINEILEFWSPGNQLPEPTAASSLVQRPWTEQNVLLLSPLFFWIMLQESPQWGWRTCPLLETVDQTSLHTRTPTPTPNWTSLSVFSEGTKVETGQTRARSSRKGHHGDLLASPWTFPACVCLNEKMRENDFCAFWTALYGNESVCSP
jgi:hypothetical protein